jgi:putative PIN family toxin of toxin-antitoxin system
MRHLWRLRRAVPLVSRTTAAELLRVLAYPKFKLTGAEQDELLGDFLPFAEVVEIPSPVPKTPPCRDPKDRPFLELAMAGRAEALVTGDDDLLVLRGRFVVPILRPEEWLATLQGDK